MRSVAPKYIFDETAHIWRLPATVPFAYSDGDEVEKFLLELLLNVEDLSVHSDELRALQTDWVTTYHLSSSRSNLLRPLASTLLQRARILELGCGCGAITRYLGETAKEVLAVDGSVRRATIAAARCRDLPNVTLIADSFSSLQEDPGTFDVVTLIGVLEYARLFDNGPKAELALLQKARSFLKPGGVLILAIENKMGLKYLAGVPEDHLGTSWTGILGAYADKGVTTWSRAELVALFDEAGFAAPQQFISIPDYKLPTTVITPSGLAAPPEELRMAPLLSLRPRPYEQRPLFSALHAWESVCKAELLADLTDSLCFTVANDNLQEGTSPWPKGVLVSHYGDPSRPKRYAKEMHIVNAPGGLNVIRSSLFPGLQSENAEYKQQLEDEPYIYGDLLLMRCRRILLRRGWSLVDLANALRPWGNWLLDQVEQGTDRVPASLIDATPFNILIDDFGHLTVFDREWTAGHSLRVTSVFLRCLLVTVSLFDAVAEPKEGTPLDFWSIADELIRLLRFPLCGLSLEELLLEGLAFSDAILPGTTRLADAALVRLNIMPLSPEQVRQLQRDERILRDTLQQKQVALDNLLSSRSWRLTEPLRRCALYVRRVTRKV